LFQATGEVGRGHNGQPSSRGQAVGQREQRHRRNISGSGMVEYMGDPALTLDVFGSDTYLNGSYLHFAVPTKP
jgi:hypothetical protein